MTREWGKQSITINDEELTNKVAEAINICIISDPIKLVIHKELAELGAVICSVLFENEDKENEEKNKE